MVRGETAVAAYEEHMLPDITGYNEEATKWWFERRGTRGRTSPPCYWSTGLDMGHLQVSVESCVVLSASSAGHPFAVAVPPSVL